MNRVALAVLLCTAATAAQARVRIATFNVALNRPLAGALIEELRAGSAQARAVAAIVQRVRPDVLLLNEVDHDEDGRAVELLLRDYFAVGQGGAEGIEYPHRFDAPVNTGVGSGLDLDGDGERDGPGDAWGYGAFPGQYGMVLLSRLPIATDRVRTFRNLRWASMPDALLPADFYGAEARAALPLSSKSHWDVPVVVDGRLLHVLASHPTPPVFDGPEDRNGRRNHDEIRFWVDYVTPGHGDWIEDDAGGRGGLAPDAAFVVVGDLNADPEDGDTRAGAIAQLLRHPRIDAQLVPASAGAAAAAETQGGANARQRGDPAHDTGDFSDRAVGNLRLDYVLPSRGGDPELRPRGGGVFWPAPGDADFALVGDGSEVVSSDHRLTWLDVELAPRPQQLVGEPFGTVAPLHLLGDRADLPGKRLTLLRWWTDTCPYCAASLPALEDLRTRFGERGFEVLAVYHPKPPRPVDDVSVQAAAERLGFRGPLAVDAGWEKLGELWARGAPRQATSISVLVDGEGRVLWVHEGPRLHPSVDGSHPQAERAYRDLERHLERVLGGRR